MPRDKEGRGGGVGEMRGQGAIWASSRQEPVSLPWDPAPSYLDGDEGLLVVDVDEYILPRTE